MTLFTPPKKFFELHFLYWNDEGYSPYSVQNMEKDTLVKDVKFVICTLYQIPKEKKQTIFYGKKELQDELTLGHYQIVSETLLRLEIA